MEESAPSSVAWWKYVVWSALIVAVFGVSIAGGHWWSSRSYRAAQESTSPTVEAPTQGVPGPVALEILSELEVAKLQDGIDTTVLEQWWQILGVNAQALTLKELGGFPTYTPSHVKIIFKDISPLSPETRQELYKPVSGMPGTPIMAGLSTEAASDGLVYTVWYAPELVADGSSQEVVEERLNRQLFEVLYEAVVGSTELDRDHYEAKLEQAFPEHGGGLGIIKLEDSEQSSGVTPSLWNRTAWQLSNLMERISTWQWVPRAHAQSCGGNYKCGAISNNCICSTTGNTCSGNGTNCGPGDLGGKCNCSTICVQETGALNSCNVAYGVCGSGISCSQCVALNTCAWSGPTPTVPTTPATCGNGTCNSGETCSNCSADCGTCSSGRCEVEGKVEKYDNASLNNATGVVSLWSSLGVNTAGTNGSGNYAFSKNYDNVGDIIKVYVNNPYGTYRTFKVKGNVPNGCSIQDDGKTISCPKGKCYEREDGDLAFNFEEVAPSRPDAKISNVSNLKYGETLTWTVEATDADGNLKDTGLFIHSGGISTAIGDANNWSPLKWIGGQNASSITYKHSDAQGVNTWICDSSRNGTWTLAAYAKDTGGLVCSGNPMAGEARCDTSDDRKVFTCSPSPSPTPQVCAAPSLTVNRTCSGTNSTDTLSWDAVSSCSWYQITWGSDNTPSDWPAGNNFAASSTSKSFTGVNGNTPQCYRVKCTTASACNATGVQSGIVCKAACPTATPTTAPSACGGSIPAGAEAHDAEESQSPIPSGTNWTYSANDGNNTKCQYKCASGYVRSGSACVAPTTAPSACGGSIPSGAEAHDAEESTNVPDGTNWTYRENDNNTKCQYKCASGYVRSGSACVAPTAAPSACATPSNLSCGGSCNNSGQMVVSCTFNRDVRVTRFTINYDDDSGFGNDSSMIDTAEVTGNTSSVSYDSTTTFPNQTHWYRIKNLTSDGTCTVSANQYTNVVSTGPATCGTYACTGGTPPPADNATVCTNDQTGLNQNTQWKNVSLGSCTGGANNKCQWHCNSGYSWDGSACVADGYACTGTRPANTLYYNGDNQPTSSGVSWQYANANTNRKCEYTCDTDYTWNSTTGACELPSGACSAPVISGAITCDADGNGMLTGSWAAISGANSYRFQRNTSAATAGAVAATINGTSFSVPIDEPDVTNYFRVRVQTVTNAAACTAVGSWSGWYAVAAGTNCVAPTDEPTACPRPGNITTTATCEPDPQLEASWGKATGVLHYEYQIKKQSDAWSQLVAEGVVSQPLGSVNPVMPAYSAGLNPSDLNVRVRSVCSDGAGGEISSTWRTKAVAFDPPACGGPYEVIVNLYENPSGGNCNGSQLLSGAFTGEISVNPLGGTAYPVSAPSASVTLSNLEGTNLIRPQYGQFSDNETPGWVRASCQPNTQVQVESAADSPLSFYFSRISGPWWQSRFGDVYGGSITSKIPMSTTHLSMSGNGNDAGATIWKTSPTLGSVSQANASQKGYRDQEVVQVGQDYSHFASLLTASPVASVRQTNTGTYKVPGSVTVDAPWNITGNNKVTVVVPGNLTINHNIAVQEGSFLFVVVNGTITIAHNVSDINGIFLAEGDITIESGRNATPQVDDVKLSARGSVISFGDITSLRSLPGSDNNGQPATEFIYRPDLIINTPDSLRSKSTVWQEVAP